jgi:peptidoglycan/xylan/chitin deacetylase (PgdA/CDA1 family)
VNDHNDAFFPAITTALFDAQMRYVSRHYRVVSLAELVRRLEGQSSQPVVAITFDDGYRDNYQNALPVLERYGLPATIFLTTGNLDSREPMWFEQLAAAIQKSLRDFVDLEIDSGRRYWLRTSAERLECLDRVFSIFRDLPDAERRIWLPKILQKLAVPDKGEHMGKMLTWDQVRFMQKRGIDFGGHTVTHPFLSRMPGEQVSWEVSECKRRIEEELQQPVAHFAYPNGREKDFGVWNKDLIRKAGYRSAVTTIWGPNYRSTDPMELRRGGPWEKSPAVFAYKLDWYQWVDS